MENGMVDLKLREGRTLTIFDPSTRVLLVVKITRLVPRDGRTRPTSVDRVRHKLARKLVIVKLASRYSGGL